MELPLVKVVKAWGLLFRNQIHCAPKPRILLFFFIYTSIVFPLTRPLVTWLIIAFTSVKVQDGFLMSKISET